MIRRHSVKFINMLNRQLFCSICLIFIALASFSQETSNVKTLSELPQISNNTSRFVLGAHIGHPSIGLEMFKRKKVQFTIEITYPRNDYLILGDEFDSEINTFGLSLLLRHKLKNGQIDFGTHLNSSVIEVKDKYPFPFVRYAYGKRAKIGGELYYVPSITQLRFSPVMYITIPSQKHITDSRFNTSISYSILFPFPAISLNYRYYKNHFIGLGSVPFQTALFNFSGDGVNLVQRGAKFYHSSKLPNLLLEVGVTQGVVLTGEDWFAGSKEIFPYAGLYFRKKKKELFFGCDLISSQDFKSIHIVPKLKKTFNL